MDNDTAAAKARMQAQDDERIARRLIIDMVNADPFEGASATYSIGSDAYGYTIVQVLSAKRLVVLSNGISERWGKDWDGTTKDNAKTLTLRADGHWVVEGAPGGRKRCGTWTLGVAIDYRDPSY